MVITDTDNTSANWYVYMMRCADGTLYTGITTDVVRREREHNAGGRLGARYTRARRPVRLVYSETAPSKSAAARREHALKVLDKSEKEALLSTAGRPSALP